MLHLFCRARPGTDAEAVSAAAKVAEAAGQQVVTAALVGHKADMGFMLLGEDLAGLRRTQSALSSAGLEVTYSYLSLTEVSEYAQGLSPGRRQARLYPRLPPAGKAVFCFYPMSKRRGEVYNWYRLGYDRREALMHDHGATGRRFAGRVLQLVTASTGLDDFEWGVTLFARAADDLKDCVYAMRFDEASARYAEFGPFYVGLVRPVGEVLTLCGLSA